jgi:hypothetical protein
VRIEKDMWICPADAKKGKETNEKGKVVDTV